MFPDPDDTPASFLKQAIYFLIPLSIRINLIRPELGVLFGWPIVIWATVPIAAVNEDGYTGSCEEDVS